MSVLAFFFKIKVVEIWRMIWVEVISKPRLMASFSLIFENNSKFYYRFKIYIFIQSFKDFMNSFNKLICPSISCAAIRTRFLFSWLPAWSWIFCNSNFKQSKWEMQHLNKIFLYFFPIKIWILIIKRIYTRSAVFSNRLVNYEFCRSSTNSCPTPRLPGAHNHFQ